MSERKVWTRQEDDLLRKLQQKQGTQHLKWGEIAQLVSQVSQGERTGKQCRERWHNQLKPGISKQRDWTPKQQQILFSMQEQLGNKWAVIANVLEGRTDNNIKNYFYSTLRKALRKINNYVLLHKRQQKYRNVKEFKQPNLSKILTVAQNKHQNKINVKEERANQLAKDIKKRLVEIERNEIEISRDSNSHVEEVIEVIQAFNRICKKRKGKKKDEDDMQEEELKNSNELDKIQNQKRKVKEIVEVKNKKKKINIQAKTKKQSKPKRNNQKQLIDSSGYLHQSSNIDRNSLKNERVERNDIGQQKLPKRISYSNKSDHMRDSSNLQVGSKSGRRSSQSQNISSSFREFQPEILQANNDNYYSQIMQNSMQYNQDRFDKNFIDSLPHVQIRNVRHDQIMIPFQQDLPQNTMNGFYPGIMFESVNFTRQCPELFKLNSSHNLQESGMLINKASTREGKRSTGNDNI